ncbi:MAG: aminopeptidase P family protein [Nanoarchaeota archaeon]|nr:aminopeptidase P family protein [Nanoarchaeota archaeon]
MKLKILQDWLKQEKIELLCLTHLDENLRYFTNFKPSFGFLLIEQKKAQLFLTELDEYPKIDCISVKKLTKNCLKKLENKKIKKIGLNKCKITVRFYEKLQKTYPKAKFIDISEKLAELRTIKEKKELNQIKKACQITDSVFSELLKNIRKLKTEREVARFLESRIKEKGAELAFPSIVASGKNSATPHHQTSHQKLGQGFLLLDFGACYQGYCADMTRMLYLGKISQQEQEKYDLLLKVQEEAIKQIKAKMRFSALDKFARKALGQYSSHFIHSLGHGVGLETHEAPRISPESKEKVQKNCVFTIEPGIYFPGKFGIRIEDTVLFDEGVKVLTESSKKLKIIGI